MRKLTFGDSLYYMQIVLGFVMGGSQLWHMIRYSTHGLSTTMFLFAALFVVLNLMLASKVYYHVARLAEDSQKSERLRVARQTVIIYIIGAVIYVPLFVVMLVKANDLWDARDTVTAMIVISVLLVAVTVAKVRRMHLFHPIMKGCYSLIFKSVPQLLMAFKIAAEGGSGLAVLMVVTFHILALSRIYQILRTGKQVGWDKNLVGLLVAEIGNELSWSCVTVAWIGYF